MFLNAWPLWANIFKIGPRGTQEDTHLELLVQYSLKSVEV